MNYILKIKDSYLKIVFWMIIDQNIHNMIFSPYT